MSVKLRLKRMGRSNLAFFRLSAIDSRSPRDGRVIEELGFYDPRTKDVAKQFVAKLDRCKYWLDVGAVPSETVSSLLKKSGLDHKQLRLPKPGKPKPAAAEAPKKEAVAKTEAPAGATPTAEAPAAAPAGEAPVAEAKEEKQEAGAK
ncbi:MAG: 30S ribosomal protein S16 [Tepidisphaeraceae bacterium]